MIARIRKIRSVNANSEERKANGAAATDKCLYDSPAIQNNNKRKQADAQIIVTDSNWTLTEKSTGIEIGKGLYNWRMKRMR